MDENAEKKPRKTRCDKGMPRHSVAAVERKLAAVNAKIARIENATKRKADVEAELAAANAKLAEMLAVAHV